MGWLEMDCFGSGVNGFVSSLTEYNGSVYAGGNFSMAGGNTAHNVAAWNGSSWAALGSGTNGNVATMTVFSGSLFIGGQFTSTGGSIVNHIARWDGTNWNALGAGMNNNVLALEVYNSTLYAGGQFDSADGVPANHIASLVSIPTSVTAINAIATTVSVYPNPSSGIFNFQINNSQLTMDNAGIEIDIYNILGEKVHSQFSIVNSTLSIDISNQPVGIYIYKILSGEGRLISCGRIVVR